MIMEVIILKDERLKFSEQPFMKNNFTFIMGNSNKVQMQ